MSETGQSEPAPAAYTQMAARIVAAYAKSNSIAASDLPKLIATVRGALASLIKGHNANGQTSALPVERSITPDYLICLEDGRRFKTLKRHLRLVYGMTPAQYREKWRLPPNYPMVAPNYGRARSNLAKRVGLGKRGPKPARIVGSGE